MRAAFCGCVLMWQAAVSAAAPPDPTSVAELLVTGRIWTGSPEHPWAEAMAVRGDRIVAVGTQDDIIPRIGPDTRRDEYPPDRLIVPGFIDSHVHLITGGAGLASVQLRDAKTRDEFVARISRFATEAPPGEWVLRGNWDHSHWGGTLPTCHWIDAATPDRPVWVQRLDGHMALANSAAMRRAGVSKETADVPGGTIVRDDDGRPTGIFKDNAMDLIARAVPEPTDAELDRGLAAAMDYLAANGVTSVHHMGSWRDLSTFRRARDHGTLKTRIYAAVPLATWRRLAEGGTDVPANDAWLKTGGLKGFVDGSLGSHTAAMLRPYEDAPEDRGLLVNTADQRFAWVRDADRAGLHVMVHAIGDRAIRDQLDVFERVIAENGPRDRRFRIEHAQHIAPPDLDRFAMLNVIASMQPYHAIDDGRWAEALIGSDRARTSYAFRSLIDRRARLAFGSDWFVAPANPLEGLYAAVTRETLDGKHPGGWVPAEKISVEEALRSYTRDAAFASFDEDQKGQLRSGMLADFVVLNRDVTRIPAREIAAVRVVRTYVGGQAVYP